MSLSDPIADTLTRIRNAGMAFHPKVSFDASKIKMHILTILKKEGFISDFKLHKKEAKKPKIEVVLKYFDNRSVIRKIIRISKPSLRKYISAQDIQPVKNNMGIMIMSTSQGIMTGREAKAKNLGGECICKLW